TDADYYKMEGGLAVERPETEIDALLSDAPAIHIVGIVKPKADSVTANSIGGIAYPSSLMRELYARVEDSPVVKAQRGDTAHDVFTGAPFAGYVLDDVPGLREVMSQNPQVAPMLVSMTDEQVLALANRYLSASLESNYRKLGVVNEEEPSSVYIYPKDFDSKDVVTQKLNEFSNTHSKLTYTDTVALLLSSVTTIVNAISYVLVAFVAISLVVSSIMIGVITYISVLERIREIGILRAMGASKRDVARVFNAETAVIGFAAGGIGIAVSLGLIVIINIILHALTGLSTLSAVLSLPAALILIGISVLLTIIAGLVPSGVAARKDPVVALRTE
ncbi:MAG: ABC transporter permease, partial [Clostridia bacterium]|nr:ABC transporter permease [Clostridia bacterium]